MQYIIDAQDGRRWYYPAMHTPCTMPAIRYGEGDLKCIHWAAHLSSFERPPVLVMTIDWDVILALVLFAANIHVWIGTVYIHKEMVGALQW